MECSQLPEKALRLSYQSSTQHRQHRLQSIAVISRRQGHFLPSFNYCPPPTLYGVFPLKIMDYCYQQKKGWKRNLLTDQNSINKTLREGEKKGSMREVSPSLTL